MLLYSKYKLVDVEVNFLVKDDVPSISCKIILPSGERVQLWGLHPEPPVPGESLTSTAKDKELSMVALKAKECKLPVIVMGDLNDVAWSYTTSLFTKTSCWMLGKVEAFTVRFQPTTGLFDSRLIISFVPPILALFR